MKHTYFYLVILGLIASCSSTKLQLPEDTPKAVIPVNTNGIIMFTDSPSYFAKNLDGVEPGNLYSFTLTATLENQSVETLYLQRCYPDSKEPIYSIAAVSKEESAYGAVWACVGHEEQFVLKPGERRTDTHAVQGPNVFDGVTGEPLGILEGEFILFYSVSKCKGDGGCPDTGSISVQSNTFEVKLAK